MVKKTMEFFYPLGDHPEKDPLLSNLPTGYKFAANIFFPFIKMPADWKSDKSDSPHQYYPIKEDILKYGKPVSWNSLRKKCGFDSLGETSKAVIASTFGSGVREIYRRPDLAKRLERVLDKQTYYPMEDEISVLLIDDIVAILASKGAKHLNYLTIYGEKQTYTLTEIDTDIKISLSSSSGPVTITDENEDFVFTCYFDEVSAIFFAKEDAKDLLEKTQLEGIIYDKNTPLIWEDDSYQLFK
ncbi:DUF2711 family protein [Rossellomorea vietnamensis]|uniref:DUF2711 family protein n=1 Tax=Rossellomorea vietnamensis TaxID=218284 RepID=UPI003CED1EAC